MRRYLVILVVLSLLLSGSAVGAEVIPAISRPLSLSEAVKTALRYSPMVQSAGYQAAAASARVGMAKAMSKPQAALTAIGGSASMTGFFLSPPNVQPTNILAFPATGTSSSQLMAMLPIYTGGRISAAVRGFQALSSAASSDRAATERNVALEVKTTYHRAVLAKATVEVYQDLVREEEERVRVAEAAFGEGKIAKFDLLRNQSGLADARQMLADSQRDAAIALINLKTALGVSQDSDIALSDPLAYSPVTDSIETFEQTAERNRPELAAARLRVASAESNTLVAKSTYKPQVYLNGMYGATTMSGASENGYTVGVAAALPILDGGQRRSGVKEAEAMVGSMRQDESQALLIVRQDVRTAWIQSEAADKKVKLSEVAVTQADEDYRVIKLRYEAGKAINVEVLDALASLVKARTNRLAALYEHNVARDMLAKAIGEL